MALTYDPITDFYTWPTHFKDSITPHFGTYEFHSNDPACKTQRIRGELLERLERVRTAIGATIMVRSGFRTAEDQERLKRLGYETSKGISQHELGAAADICADDMETLLRECEKEFMAIGVAKSFIHVDLRDDKIRRWDYGSHKG